jgi:hypothetical protein
MRKIFRASLILAAVGACGTGTAGAATPRVLNAFALSHRADWVGQVDGTTLAYGARTVGSGIQVLADGTGTPRVVAAPPDGPYGCAGAAAGAGHLLFSCNLGYASMSVTRRAIVTAADGTVEASRDYTLQGTADGSTPGEADAIGAHWIHHPGGCYHCGGFSVDVDWQTGAVREPRLGSLRNVEDLDAPDAVTRLCAPLKQSGPPADAGEFDEWPATLGLQRSGHWVLQGVYAPSSDAFPPVAWRLRHCGTTKVYKMPGGAEPLALAGGFVVMDDGGLELLRLRDRRVFRIAGVYPAHDSSFPQVAATAHRMLIRGDATSRTVLWTVRLPQR